MKHTSIASATLVALLSAGCAGLQEYQASCEQKHSSFPAFATCYKTEVLADSRSQNDARVKLLLLKTDQLAERVKAGQLSDLDARVEFQQVFVSLSDAANSEEAARRAASSTTNCVMRGKKMTCSPY